ncbi:MAG TPA: hypothetical protein VK550_27125 [Polyangiaceae bacterium]|nr:hypothetical protein [Polyangiaceae bacterium]
MNTKLMGQARLTLLGLGALGAFLILPIACGGDDDVGEAGGSAGRAGSAGRGGGGAAGRGGTGGAAGAKDAGSDRADVTTDTRIDNGGAGGTGGAGGGGPDATVDVIDVSTPPDGPGGGDGDGGPTCSNPTNATKGKACLIFTPEQITFADAGPLLDGQGTLFIHVFGTPTPGDTTPPLAQVIYPPPNADGGLNQTSVYALPQIEIDNLPTDLDGSPGTLYIRTLFVDNPLWLQTQKGLTYGMFVGGYNLNNGVQSSPPLRAVPLATGSGTVVRQPLTALRRFTTVVALGLPNGGTPAGNGQGPMSLGVFAQASPAGMPPVFGGLQVPCADVTKGPIQVAGFFYATGTDRDFWIGAQVDDFGIGGDSPAGSLISVTATGEIPGTQRITITADQYSASIPQVTLTSVRPIAPDAGTDNLFCPGSNDAGTDAGRDGGPDSSVDASDGASPDTGADVGTEASTDAADSDGARGDADGGG